jgi:hypothetical protein
MFWWDFHEDPTIKAIYKMQLQQQLVQQQVKLLNRQ